MGSEVAKVKGSSKQMTTFDINRCTWDFPYYTANLLKIKDMDMNLSPLVLNMPQQQLHARIMELQSNNQLPRIIVLKARREGVSTYAESRMFHSCHFHENTDAAVIAHEKESGDKIFQMCRLFYDSLPSTVRPMTRYSNKKELVFDNPDAKTRHLRPGLRSSITVLTAGKKDVARGAGYHHLHASELASWTNPQDTIPALVPTVPKNPENIIIYESTAKGVGNYFHNEWIMAEEGASNFVPFFLAWYDLPYYARRFNNEKEREILIASSSPEEKELHAKHGLSYEQLYWRRTTIADYAAVDGGGELFRQEYPITPEEAFIVSGVPIFDRARLRKLAVRCNGDFGKPLFRGNLSAAGLVKDNERGELSLWQFPVLRQKYYMAVDVADGGEDGDFSCIQVLRLCGAKELQMAEQVAEWHGKIDPVGLAKHVELLGRLYNEALVAVETNSHGSSTQDELKRTYWNLYRPQYIDRIDSKFTTKLGWDTSLKTKKLLIAIGANVISNESVVIRSMGLVRELTTFVRDGEAACAAGTANDDRVMAFLIACFVLHQDADSELTESLGSFMPDVVGDVLHRPKVYVDRDVEQVLATPYVEEYENNWMNF